MVANELMVLDINSRDLAYTIDTYGTFNGDGFYESEGEFYKEEYGVELDWLEYDLVLDHEGLVKTLALDSISELENNLKGDIVKSIDLVKTTSPQFYNYTTDNYTATWHVDASKLFEYIKANFEAYRDFIREEWHAVYIDVDFEKLEFTSVDDMKNSAKTLKDFEDVIVSMIDYYTRNEYDPEDYDMSMFEHESEAYSNNVTESPKLKEVIENATR